jgi:heat shock protein HslJ/uncharacterized membrane protein
LTGLRWAIIGLAAVLTAGASHAADDSLTARGNEPSWRLDVSAAGIDFEAPGLGLTFKAPVAARDVQDGRPRIIAEAGGERLEAMVIEQPCADTMTGMPFPTGVEVSYAGRTFQGCGGEIMTAIEGGWRVIRLGGSLVPEGAVVTIEFGKEGRVSGRSGCNRFNGGYTLTGEGLSFGPLRVTRMACPEPQMETEQRFLDLIQKVSRATPGENRQLWLMAGDEQAMVLDRAD